VRFQRLSMAFYLSGSLTFISAEAQTAPPLPSGSNCGVWANVSAWNVTMTLQANGSGADAFNLWTGTLSEQGSATGSLLPTSPCTWRSTIVSMTGTGSANFHSTSVPCPGWTGSGSGSGFTSSSVILAIDGTKNTYTVLPDITFPMSGSSTLASGSCPLPPQDATFQESSLWSILPIQLISLGPPFSFAYNPVTLPLPADVGVLQQTSMTFNAFNDPPGPLGSPSATWNFSFTLTPMGNALTDNIDDQCSQPGSSTIGCQDQSLGEVVPVIGTGLFLHYESERAPARAGATAVASKDSQMLAGWTVNVHHAYDPSTYTLFLGNGRQRSVWKLGAPAIYNGKTYIASEAGSEVYVFSNSGQHLQTLLPLTGALAYQFGYDTAGNLTSVTDGSGNVTNIQRDSSGHPTAIISPLLLTTTLNLDSSGFLSQVTDPAGHTTKFVNTRGGLITSRNDANGNVSSYSYNDKGKLTQDTASGGGVVALSRTDTTSGYTVAKTTAMGRKSVFQVTAGVPGEQLTNTWPNGLQSTSTSTQQNAQISQASALPNGASSNTVMSPDPRWGLSATVPTSGTITRGNLTMTTGGSRTATLGTVGNPFSLSNQTDTATANGRTYTSVFTSATRTYVHTSPAKRITTTVLDSLERVSSRQAGALLPVTLTYDSRGRLSTITQGPRVTALAYDSKGFATSITDPLNLTTSFTHDSVGRLTSTILPDGRIISFTYDAVGNLINEALPGGSVHGFSFTPTNLLATYTPPVVTGTGAASYQYDGDRKLTKITRPDGETIAYGYDNAGRLVSKTIPTATINYSFDAQTGNVTGATVVGGEALAYGYNGPLVVSSTWTGPVPGSVGRTYNNDFGVMSQTINGANAVIFGYDSDGLLTSAGALTLTRDPTSGLIAGTTLGDAADSRAYDTFGQLTAYTAAYKNLTLYTATYTFDADGRISGKTENVGGKTNTFAYSYDAAGRLKTVTKNGASPTSYAYDADSNRLAATTVAGAANATYDAQDRLLTYGSASYTYTANGELVTQTLSSQKATYTYDVLGNLLAAVLPSGTRISYIVDALNRRIGKQANGALQAGFLYDGRRVVAQLNLSNTIVSQFVYASRSNTPDYMISGGVTYRIFSDQVGSPRLVVNTNNGVIAEQIDYDEFGNVLSDTAPGFQPFGFAGGLYDVDTKLVRFGARDYDATVGRWTIKDPLLVAGSAENLYVYGRNDPVNSIDPSGLKVVFTNARGDSIPNVDPSLAEALTMVIQSPTGGEAWNDLLNSTNTIYFGPATFDPKLDGRTLGDEPLCGPTVVQINNSGNPQLPQSLAQTIAHEFAHAQLGINNGIPLDSPASEVYAKQQETYYSVWSQGSP
jgi:RHS repeat-associated protein